MVEGMEVKSLAGGFSVKPKTTHHVSTLDASNNHLSPRRLLTRVEPWSLTAALKPLSCQKLTASHSISTLQNSGNCIIGTM